MPFEINDEDDGDKEGKVQGSLAQGGGKYFLAMPMRRGDEVTEDVLSRPGRYRTVAENLEVKEVSVGEGERRRRYALCFNPLEAKRQKLHREERLGELEAERASLSDLAKASHTKRVCALRTSARYGRLLKETKQGLAIDRQAVTERERFDGKFVGQSNDDTLTAEDMALGYKQQQRVEEAWRTMKSVVGNDMYQDVYGAQRVGMKTAFFKSNQGSQEKDGVKPDYIIYNFPELPNAIRFFDNSISR